jgi:hypothetical protein
MEFWLSTIGAPLRVVSFFAWSSFFAIILILSKPDGDVEDL